MLQHMEWLPLIILAVVVVAITVIHDRSAQRAAEHRVAETERILAAFVEQTTNANKHMSGIYNPPPSPGSTDTLAAYETELQRMMGRDDFDDFDPTDAYLQPERKEAVIIGDDGHNDDANPFGIPGLGVRY